MVLEKLIALGAQAVVALGWCGSLQPHVKLGSLVLPTGAVGGDGASSHYRLDDEEFAPHNALLFSLERCLSNHPEDGVSWHTGSVWTTDAYYRETVDLVQHYQELGILAVDLELAALFAVGQFRGIPVAGLLAVSDELFTLNWRPGHRSPHLRRAREAAAHAVLTALTGWREDDA